MLGSCTELIRIKKTLCSLVRSAVDAGRGIRERQFLVRWWVFEFIVAGGRGLGHGAVANELLVDTR